MKFHRFADDKFAKCKSACNYIFRNPSMTAYKIESRKSKLANILFRVFDHYETGGYIKCLVNYHPVGRVMLGVAILIGVTCHS